MTTSGGSDATNGRSALSALQRQPIIRLPVEKEAFRALRCRSNSNHRDVAISAVLATVALTACSGSSAGGGASTTTATTTTTTTTPTSTPTSTAATATVTASPSSGATSGSEDVDGSGSAGPAVCRETQLRSQIDPRPIGASAPGDKAIIVQFINTSNSTCTLHGYPGAALVNSSGKQVHQATRTIRGKLLGLPTSVDILPTVTLKPGAVASAGIEGVNEAKSGTADAVCGPGGDTYPGIVVTPPNTATPVPLTVKWPVCYSFTVHPTNIDKTAN